MPTTGAKTQRYLLHLSQVDFKWGRVGSPKDICSTVIGRTKRQNRRKEGNAG